MVLSNGKKVIIGLLVGVFCLGFLGYLGYETYVKETGDDPLGEYFDDQDNKKIIKYEDETGLIITEYELKQMRKRNPATPDHELIESEN